MNPIHTISERWHIGSDQFKPLLLSVISQVATRGGALAVSSESGSLTYEELNSRSRELAEHLRALGVGSDVVVGLCLRRSPALFVAALATLRAGGAYLPMDPSYPEKRLTYLLKDASVRVVVTDEATGLGCPRDTVQVITLDDSGKIVRVPSGTRDSLEPVIVKPDHLAYVIYTSGSTGEPKGVEITHAGLSNLAQWHQQAFKVTAADRASQVARIGFDAAVWETWPYLSAGASLHLPSEGTLNDPEALRDWLVVQEITISFVPTPMAERLISLQWPAKTALRIMLTGGDVLHRHPPADLPFALVNNYGPTECTVVATSSVLPPKSPTDKLPTIGLPIANTRLYILDKMQRPVPDGTEGELYIGGAGVARGYRGRPDLTAERFLPDPLAVDLSARIFRTGDLVQQLPDGQFAFLGRLDEQVKIRGFRIEPDEIVAALNTHSAIFQSAVIAREISPGDRRLIAYFVPRGEASPTLSDLREFLAAHLPDFMVPSAFVGLKALPLTAHGKVDRAALPPPDDTNILRDEEFAAPSTEIEKTVVAILSPLLGLSKVGVTANFFALGGHSLLGTQLITRLRDTFGVELPLRSVFEAPTIAELSAEIDRLLLAKVEAMSEEEVQHLLNSNPKTHAKNFIQ